MYKPVLCLITLLQISSCRVSHSGSGLDSLEPSVARLGPAECLGIMQGLGFSAEKIQNISDRRVCSCEDDNTPYRTEFHYVACLKAYGAYYFSIPESFTYVNDAGELDSAFGMRLIRNNQK